MSTSATETRHQLTLLPRHLQAVRHHAAGAYPEECCGFLMGVADEDGVLVERVLPARNEHADDRCHRFLIPPETVLAARKEARGLGLEIVGYYHSHPDLPAEPSDRDREHAWPDVSYLIVPVEDGVPGEARSWRLSENGAGFEEEGVETAGRPAVAGRRKKGKR